MDLNTIQIIFYTLGSVFFALLAIILIFVGVTAFIIYKRFTKISKDVSKTISEVKDLYDHKEKYILKLVTKGSGTIMDSISNFFGKNKK